MSGKDGKKTDRIIEDAVVGHYRAVVGRSPGGRLLVKLTPTSPTTTGVEEGHVTACLDEITQELKRRGHETDGRWAISPGPNGSQMVVELRSEEPDADGPRVIKQVLAELRDRLKGSK